MGKSRNTLNPVEKHALTFAAIAHNDQFRRDGFTPYIVHLVSVANSFDDTSAKVVAYLHDILEDTLTMEHDLRIFFGDEVANAVVLLTRNKHFAYRIYMDRLLRSKNLLALRVKLADMLDNRADGMLDFETYESLIRRYDFYIPLIQAAIKELQ